MLTKSEKQVMDLLWTVGEPLSCRDIVARSESKTWKDSYIRIMTRSLLDKGIIKVGTIELVNKNYTRKFVPAMTKEEYLVNEILSEGIWSKCTVPALFSAFVNNGADPETLDKMQELLSKKKAELKG